MTMFHELIVHCKYTAAINLMLRDQLVEKMQVPGLQEN